MFARSRSAVSCISFIFALSATILLLAVCVFAQAPGGFLEKATSTDVRPMLTQSEIQALLPARGLFTFPSPYLTQGIRLTNDSDCGGTDCVKYVGYSYWRNINNHSGSDEMLIFLTLRGNGGPTLFSYNKATDAVTKLGALFAAGSSFSSATGEGWYFSAAQPTKLYLNSGPKLLRYDVFTKQFETVFDVSTQPALFGANRIIWQMHSSNDDRVHSATLKDGTTYAALGCFAYDEALIQFYYYPKLGAYDECQIDKSGRWLLIKENVDGISGEDNRIIDVQTGTETVLLDQLGAGGHSDNGSEYMVAADNWNILPGAIRMWKFGQNPLQGPVVYRDPSWATQSAQHVSHANTKAGVPPEQQYACGSGARTTNGPRANEIVCFRLDTSYDVLVVAPVMTDMNAPGGGDSYSKLPKGNLDVTGQYFIWTSNMASSRLDAFIVKIPAQLLTGLSSDNTPPTVSITSPLNGTTVSNFISVSAAASDNVGVAGVQFKLDGVNLGSEFTTSPYSISWNTTTATNASHTLTAVARDAAGNLATSSPVTVTVSNNDITPPIISSVTAPLITSSGATITWTTNEASDTQTEYGPTISYGSSTTLNTTLVTSHSVTLSAMAPSTLYHYRVKSRDAAGNLAVSGDFTFTTLAALDITSPSVSITAPTSGSTVAGTTTVSASASDNVGVVGVQFKLDAVNLGAEDTMAPYSISWNTTTATNGSHLLTAVARDATGNSTTSTAITVTVNNDITSPVISLVSSSNISSSGSTITWTTNEASDSQVEFGLTTTYGSSTALATNMVTSHPQTLSGLAANTLYHYRVKSRDAAGNLATSGDFTFTTLAPPPPDLAVYRTLTPITLDGVLGEWSGAGAARFSGLSNSATAYLLWDATNLYVAFQVTDAQLSAIQTARDASALYQDDTVEVYLDTRADRTTTMQSDDYQFLVNLNNAQGDLRGTGGGKDPAWNTTWLSAVTRQGTLNSHGDTDSGYTVEIAIPWAQIGVTPSIGMYLGMDLAVDDKDAATFDYFDWARITLGSYAQPNLWKWIQLADAPPDTTPPSVAITSPSPGATVSGTITVSGTAADNVALSRVEVLVDSDAPLTASGTNVWNLTLNTLALSNGTHAVVARVLDTASNTSTASVSVTVFNDTIPPAVSITSPLSGATVSGTMIVSSSASDNVGAAGIQFQLDGANLGAEVTVAPYSISWNTTTATNGFHLLTAVARDAAGNSTTSTALTVTVNNDITAPAISMVSASNISSSGATITWTTDELSDSQVQYGLTTAYGSASALNTTLVTSHSVTLSALAPSTLYHYRVKSRDAAGNLAVSGDFTFTTLLPPDTTPPTVSITAPISGSTVAGTITVSASASDNVGVAGVQFELDGVNLGAEVTIGPYSVSWNTATATNGSHSLTAVARDAAGNITTSSGVTVTVANGDITPPTIFITTPTSGAIVKGNIKISASASDNVGVVGMQFKLDGVDLKAEDTTEPYTVSWKTTTVLNGTHTLTAVARDAAGNTATSAPVTVTVANNDTTSPVISSVSASNISSSAATITWTTDEASDTQVEYGLTTAYGNSTSLNATLVNSHSQSLAGLAASIVYHYRVKSRDAAGNLAISGDFMFTTLAAVPVLENVVWINVVNATTTDNSLKKTSGCDGCQDAGATSQQQITSGNGYLEFMASETTTLRYAGLSNGNTGTGGAEIAFAIRLQSGYAEVREKGVYKADTPFVTGDVFRVAVESGVIKYYKNGTLFYRSTVAPTYPLLVDTAISSLNGTVTNAVISRGP